MAWRPSSKVASWIASVPRAEPRLSRSPGAQPPTKHNKTLNQAALAPFDVIAAFSSRARSCLHSQFDDAIAPSPSSPSLPMGSHDLDLECPTRVSWAEASSMVTRLLLATASVGVCVSLFDGGCGAGTGGAIAGAAGTGGGAMAGAGGGAMAGTGGGATAGAGGGAMAGAGGAVGSGGSGASGTAGIGGNRAAVVDSAVARQVLAPAAPAARRRRLRTAMTAAGGTTAPQDRRHAVVLGPEQPGGQLGDGTTTDTGAPGPGRALGNSAAQLPPVMATRARARPTTRLWCWGCNGRRESGDGTTMSEDFARPGDRAREQRRGRRAAGGAQTCARKGDGTLWCWGANNLGAAGNGTTDALSPVQSDCARH